MNEKQKHIIEFVKRKYKEINERNVLYGSEIGYVQGLIELILDAFEEEEDEN